MPISEEKLVLDIGFAIQDPLGGDAVLLARALLSFGKKVPESAMRPLAELLNATPLEFIVEELLRSLPNNVIIN